MTRRSGTLHLGSNVPQHVLDRADEAKLLEDRAFCRFLLRLFDKTGMFAETATGTPHETAQRAARQSLGTEVLDELRVAQPRVLILLEEERLLQDKKRPAPSRGATDEPANGFADDDDPESPG